MIEQSLPVPGRMSLWASGIWRKEKPWLAVVVILLGLWVLDAGQAGQSLDLMLRQLASVAPFLAASVLIAAWANATGADGLISRAFVGAPAAMIIMGALAGALSPFCSCGVIPLIAALLFMGVPLAPVMAFWLASPLMDPAMFALTTGIIGFEFAVAKTLVAVGLGLFGGSVVHLLVKGNGLSEPLREGGGNGGCGGARVRSPQVPVWSFWKETERLAHFRREGVRTALFLLKWLALAFLLESLMLAYIPADRITQTLGGEGISPIVLATLFGVPAYFNGYAALPLIATLMEQGMQAGAGMAFLIAGGVTSLPAAIAVWVLVKPRIFALYVVLSLSGAFAAGVLFQLWSLL